MPLPRWHHTRQRRQHGREVGRLPHWRRLLNDKITSRIRKTGAYHQQRQGMRIADELSFYFEPLIVGLHVPSLYLAQSLHRREAGG